MKECNEECVWERALHAANAAFENCISPNLLESLVKKVRNGIDQCEAQCGKWGRLRYSTRYQGKKTKEVFIAIRFIPDGHPPLTETKERHQNFVSKFNSFWTGGKPGHVKLEVSFPTPIP